MRNLHDHAWRTRAECRGLPLWLFYGFDDGGRPDHTASCEQIALRICQRCPVAAECLDDELRHVNQYGIRGGMTAEERRSERRRRKRRARQVREVAA
ncbi:WhiB family transcriptional regulator [Nocardiopsis sp. NPDC049922]|uniref:WhiB family transcriptional regulator n=1 Tax=Nocardiopsis sp. NPDC049922 TaxID=3155157 RepID=UPI0033FAD37B